MLNVTILLNPYSIPSLASFEKKERMWSVRVMSQLGGGCESYIHSYDKARYL